MQLAQEESSPQSYLDDKTGWEIAVMIARHFRKLLKKRVKQSPYFAIMADETTDTSTTAQLVIYIKFIEYDDETSTARVVTEYLDLITPASGKANDLTVCYIRTPILISKAAIHSCIISFELEMSKLMGFGSDGASAMAGSKSGVSTRLKAFSPFLISFHCAAHRLQLAIGDSVKKVHLFHVIL